MRKYCCHHYLTVLIVISSFCFIIIEAFHIHPSIFCLKQANVGSRSSTRRNILPDWYKKAQEESMVIVNFSSGEDVREKMTDALKRAGMTVGVDEVMLPTAPHGRGLLGRRRSASTVNNRFTKRTLREICRLYRHSMGYLGDYVCSLGVNPPLKVDVPIGEYMTGEQMHSLLTAVTTVSPHEVNRRFCDGSTTLLSLARTLNVNTQYLMDLCEELDEVVPLPFGKHTQIHSGLVGKIVNEIKGRRKYQGFDAIPPFRKPTVPSAEEKDVTVPYKDFQSADE